jgi:cytosolic phospholipase A2
MNNQFYNNRKKIAVITFCCVVLLYGMTVQGDVLGMFKELWKEAVSLFRGGKPVVQSFEKELLEAFGRVLEPTIKVHVENLSIYKNQPYTDQVATVRVGSDISDREKTVVARRLEKAKKAQQVLLGMQFEKPVNVAFVFSGGGDRAAVAEVGSLVGLEKIGALDASTYLCMLSGSTWIAPWFAHGGSMANYKAIFARNLATGLDLRNDDELRAIIDMILLKLYQKKPVSGIDIFNLLLVNAYFRDFGADRFKKDMIEQFKRVETGEMPFFINTAVLLDPKIIGGEWMEFSGVEVGTDWLNIWVPTWAWNRTFANGTSTSFDYEYPFCLGTYGGALGINLEIIYNHSIKEKITKLKPPLSQVVQDVLTDLLKQKISSKATVKDLGVTPLMSIFTNYATTAPNSKMIDDVILTMTDAGVEMGMPVPPALRPSRKVDMVIMFDNSAGDGVYAGRELQKVIDYAAKKGIPFPKIDDPAKAGKSSCSVFVPEDPRAPIVVYMPRWFDRTQWDALKNTSEFERFKPILENFDPATCIKKSYCDTMNFKYSPAQSNQLASFTEFNVLANKDTIIKAIRTAVERKNNLSPQAG